MSKFKSSCKVAGSHVWSTLMALGFSKDDAQQAMEHANTRFGPDLPVKPRVSCSRIFRYLDEREKDDKQEADYERFYSSTDECKMVFIVPPNYGTPGVLAKCVTDSLIIMQDYLNDHDDLFGSYMDTWSSRGSPSSIYTAQSKEHMRSLREQVDIVQLPVITLPTNRQSITDSSQTDSIKIICVFGPVTKINRLVRPLTLLK